MAETKAKKKKKQKAGRSEADITRFPKIVKKRQQIPRGKHGGMELMLVEHVPSLGSAGDLVEVKPGYGRNYLLPQGLATYVTPETKVRIEKHKAKLEAVRLARLADLKMAAKKLEKESVTIEANANEEGHLYGSVTANDIIKALLEAKYELDADMVKLEGPLKEVGLYHVRVVLASDVEAEVKVWVVPTTGDAEAES